MGNVQIEAKQCNGFKKSFPFYLIEFLDYKLFLC